MEENKVLTLADVPQNQECVIVKVNGHGGFRHRVMEMGFVRGEKVTVLRNAPLKDPIEYKIMQSHISLRRSEAEHIEVVSVSESEDENLYVFNGTMSEMVKNKINNKSKTITVALVGNPNCGKTSFFNYATGLREKVGNYSGVTITGKEGTFYHKGYTINIVDLPGTYSLTDFSPEEICVRSFLSQHHPDVVLNVTDSTNLERNLFLTTQLIDMNLRMVMALNMFDEFENSGYKLDCDQLETILGFPCVPVVAKSGKGINHVMDHIITVYEESEEISKHIHINYGRELEEAIRGIKSVIQEHIELAVDFPFRYVAIRLLEKDKITHKLIEDHINNTRTLDDTVLKYITEIENDFGEDINTVVTNSKFGFIRGALKETLEKTGNNKHELAYAVDVVLTNKWLGFPVLIVMLWIMFQATFSIGHYPMEWIDSGMNLLGNTIGKLLNEGMLRDLLVDGIIAGVRGVIVFLPNILILYFFLSLFEDSGYMARAAFIMDKIMHKVGLHGKSFIPLLTGFGCGVPAIMATRTLENHKDRIITMLVVPFISCSARLPVYLLFVSAFFPENQGLILLCIYLLGICVSALTALLLRKTKFKGRSDAFVMELPPYRLPTCRSIVVHMWEKSVHYLKKMGTIILTASIIIWCLNYFPHENALTRYYDTKIEQTATSQIEDSLKTATIHQLKLSRNAAQSEHSFIGMIGHTISPVFKPLDLDWKMGVSILTGISAKEIIISSLGVLYQTDIDDDHKNEKLSYALKHHQPSSDTYPITPLTALTFMVFVLLCCPCVAAISAIAGESNWKTAIFSVCYTTIVAWLFSFVIYQTGSLL